jgi:hypothetical protein
MVIGKIPYPPGLAGAGMEVPYPNPHTRVPAIMCQLVMNFQTVVVVNYFLSIFSILAVKLLIACYCCLFLTICILAECWVAVVFSRVTGTRRVLYTRRVAGMVEICTRHCKWGGWRVQGNGAGPGMGGLYPYPNPTGATSSRTRGCE